MFRSPRLAAALLGLLVLPLAACSSSTNASVGAPSAASSAMSSAASSAMSSAAGASSSAAGATVTGTQIVIFNFKFAPATMTVNAGQKVTVLNKDATAHTLTANDKSFDTGTIAPGKTGTFTAPTKPGSYPYICTIHQFMQGTLTVK